MIREWLARRRPSNEHATVERRVIDNRVFLLGLDGLYRDAMKNHERGELLRCARRVANALHVGPADIPVEGYYTEDEELTEYFCLIRSLAEIEASATPKVASLPEFQRLRDVRSAPLFGRPAYDGKLLPTGRDALTDALFETMPDWTVAGLTATAHRIAVEMDEFSLVGLAARARDPVVLTALRESVVLYAMVTLGIAPQYEYVWNVEEDLARQAGKFIDAFNTLSGERLPPPAPDQAEQFWDACKDNQILGRCVRIGGDDSVTPVRHYHWAIRRSGTGALEVVDFWQPEVWTTARYQSSLGLGFPFT